MLSETHNESDKDRSGKQKRPYIPRYLYTKSLFRTASRKTSQTITAAQKKEIGEKNILNTKSVEYFKNKRIKQARYTTITWNTRRNIFKSESKSERYFRRQNTDGEDMTRRTMGPGQFGSRANSRRTRHQNQDKKTQSWTRTTPIRVSLKDFCDYYAYYCLKAYVTGRVCARTEHFTYMTFESYCAMDYVNCKEEFEYWHIQHMGPCFKIPDNLKYDPYLDRNGIPVFHTTMTMMKANNHITISIDVLGHSSDCALNRRKNIQKITRIPSKCNKNMSTGPKHDSKSPMRGNSTIEKLTNHSFRSSENWISRIVSYVFRKPRNWLSARREAYKFGVISPEDDEKNPPTPSNIPAHQMKGPDRITYPTSTISNQYIRSGSPVPEMVNGEHCSYYSMMCMKAYDTGPVCGRTVYVTYYTFTNYCMLDYANCMEMYEVWQIAHYGPCFNISVLKLEHHHHYLYTYDDWKHWMGAHVVEREY